MGVGAETAEARRRRVAGGGETEEDSDDGARRGEELWRWSGSARWSKWVCRGVAFGGVSERIASPGEEVKW